MRKRRAVIICMKALSCYALDPYSFLQDSYQELRLAHLELPQGDCFSNVEMYKFSTLLLAQGVLRKNVSDDLIDGSLLKQLMSIL
jgi:hypothetical protein